MRTVMLRGRTADRAAGLLARIASAMLFGALAMQAHAESTSGQSPAAQNRAALSSQPSASLYQMELKLTDQESQARGLDLYRGAPVLVTMFYGSCPMACPLLIDTVRATENALTPEERARVRVLMVSVDPDRDTPAALAKLAKERRIDPKRWTLARASASDVRMLAAALNIQYRKLPNGEYNHTSVITLVNRDGEIVRQTSTLARADAELVKALRAFLR